MRGCKWILALGLALSVVACGKTPWGEGILVVDLEAVAKATGKLEVMRQEIDGANAILTGQLQNLASQLETVLIEEQEKIGDKGSEEGKKKLQAMLVQAQQQVQNSRNIALQKSQQFQSELVRSFRQDVKRVAHEIATKRGGRLVVTDSESILWLDNSIDITDEVIASFRARSADEGLNDDKAQVVPMSTDQNTPPATGGQQSLEEAEQEKAKS